MGVLSLAVVVTMLFGTATMVFASNAYYTLDSFELKEIVKGEDYPYGGDYNKLTLYWKYPEEIENYEFRLQFKLKTETEYKEEVKNLVEGEYIDVSQWKEGTYTVRIAAYPRLEEDAQAVDNPNQHGQSRLGVRNPIVKIKDTSDEPVMEVAVTNEQEVTITPKTTTAEVTTDAAEDGDDDDGDDGDGSEVGSEVVEGTDDSDSSPETGQLIFMGVIGAMAISGGLGIYARRKFGKEE